VVLTALATGAAWSVGPTAQAPPATGPITIEFDAARPRGPMKPMWVWFGYDEPNYTYLEDGTKLLYELAALAY